MGATAQSYEQLEHPVNDLEKDEDADFLWRSYINQQLIHQYPKLFNLVDQWVMLKAPSFDCVYHWRQQQEQKLREDAAKGLHRLSKPGSIWVPRAVEVAAHLAATPLQQIDRASED